MTLNLKHYLILLIGSLNVGLALEMYFHIYRNNPKTLLEALFMFTALVAMSWSTTMLLFEIFEQSQDGTKKLLSVGLIACLVYLSYYFFERLGPTLAEINLISIGILLAAMVLNKLIKD